jgi:hypothetical protein
VILEKHPNLHKDVADQDGVERIKAVFVVPEGADGLVQDAVVERNVEEIRLEETRLCLCDVSF